MTTQTARCLCAVVLLMSSASIAWADEAQTDAARQVFDKHQGSVVWVSAIMKMRAGGRFAAMFDRQEQKVDAVGTVIHESGLTVLSYSMLDPTAMLNAMMASAGGMVGEEKIEFKSELSGVKIRLADGTELPAKLILKDDDLDLAFVMPTEKGKKIPHLDLGARATSDAQKVKALDPVINIWRLGQSLDRQAAVGVGRVAAVVNKPRTFYVCSGVESVGTPTFLADGTPLGILVFRKQGAEMSLRSMMSSGNDRMPTVVVPAADVLEVAQQALTKKDEPAAAPADQAPADKAEDKNGKL
jgi:hypothetical protein